VTSQNDLVTELHEQICGDAGHCKRFTLEGSAHRDYYELRAHAIMDRLAPEIGEANVLPAVRVILSEVM
jgi:hypothetical protein